MQVHNFTESRLRGEDAEAVLDDYFSARAQIYPVTHQQQLADIDREFVFHRTGNRRTIQYKQDERSGETGNVFMELVNIGREPWDKMGWAVCCQADYLILFLPHLDSAFLFRPPDLREHVWQWLQEYPTQIRAVPNEESGSHWHTLGVLVPIPIAVDVAIREFTFITVPF